ncbi:MAG TPA: 16S rRNA (guanine(527)-N(7))-methyltransferase RsmG [Algoriphagus sp.]|mgnify:FL=1|jgi:16S rRNA (guanine527-N7)-methyltransferase|uniref:16S rRNA (guanine(527)-N(7))-methyltransferase RsmG n=1 Tax=unclassified Algoriphagus TaxID=2641541 RepID=UPI000C52E4E6|nr:MULTISPECIES: 16S rRNA (guanine(527)-N(7))-methyltransferase RsmG [unclassified Algoriphagus]MAL14309.1 16S rRNA (guanine(527)-N(7))-methyltransferase RsmG [Algoriphagus sp.]MAN88029.1 16S rRNA (guanine(527)-N(7))-methyltransferase RsmG [Algoriphagus sp.]QYH37363.1 16S rRNA (guanine(527)-N(7))-methyltransferase RsmG [Algoriphagus sp. NBT04N3]HAD52741.1 16S rRNA (guanine(527)-N(7))-methyltransferase RsmG [Algoriphagus sp.]HAH38253.1 16S rRNA (guanine(527)-N(7))-methyltransferase RsmG [Algori|tara:strand:+ start:5757 stop:6401 length:645 start_codon:yes stop_codon:yes gene_type:complete
MNTGTQLILSYFPNLTEKQIEQLDRLQELYEDWNSKINVISRKDMDQFYVHHVLHSLGIAKVMGFQPGTKVLDIGTGGGFPGIPLAILFPDTHFHLVDSIGKKITVVKEVAKTLKLSNVEAQQVRAETLVRKYDFVISRAVTRMINFYPWVKGKIKKEDFNEFPNGILYLKGGEVDEEMEETGKSYVTYHLEDYFKEEFFETKKVVYMPWEDKR